MPIINVSVLQEGGVLLTTYDIVRNNSKSIRGDWYANGDGSEEEVLWHYTVLDEGHIIKNPKTQRSQSLFEIPSAHRIIISGTPIQNNLKVIHLLLNLLLSHDCSYLVSFQWICARMCVCLCILVDLFEAKELLILIFFSFG